MVNFARVGSRLRRTAKVNLFIDDVIEVFGGVCVLWCGVVLIVLFMFSMILIIFL